MEATFLNVDLEIHSASKLDSLVAAMGKRVVVLYSGAGTVRRHLLTLESSRQHKGPDAAIRALCAAIEHLPPAARRLWNAARKEFDVGYEWPTSERSTRVILRPDTIERISKLGAALAITYYARP